MPVMSGLTPFLLRAPTGETSNDVTMTSGVGVPGAFVELTAETAIQCNYMCVFIHNPNTGNKYIVDIATGSVGNEFVVLEGILHHVNLTGMNIVTESTFFKVEIEKGTRVSARCTATLNTNTVEIKTVSQGIK